MMLLFELSGARARTRGRGKREGPRRWDLDPATARQVGGGKSGVEIKLCTQMDRAMELLSEAHSRELASAAREMAALKELAASEVDFLRRQLEAQREAHRGELEALRGALEALRGSMLSGIQSGIQAGVEEALRVDRERLAKATAQQHMEQQYRRDQRAVWLRSQEAVLRVFTIVSRMGHPSGRFSSLNRAFRGDEQLWGEIKDRCGPKVGTYLMYSAREGDLGRARWLIERGANVNAAKTHVGSTALMLASEKGHLEIAQLLVERGANVNASRTTDGMTALMWASQNSHLGIAQLLVERGANVNAACTDNGMTALMWASQECHLGIAQLLVERGANVNATKTDNGKTALMRACEKGHLPVETVRFLLSRGAGKTARNTAGKTAYALSAAYPAIRTQVKP
jgi:hypothetical protein